MLSTRYGGEKVGEVMCRMCDPTVGCLNKSAVDADRLFLFAANKK